MAVGDRYNRFTVEVQDHIIKIAKRKRRYLSEWQIEQLTDWINCKAKNKPLTEHQLFFMEGVEEFLKVKGWINGR